MICGIASVVVLFGGASMATRYLYSDLASAGLFALAWLGLWFVASVCAVVFAVLGLRAVSHREATNRGTALIGLVIGVLMLVFVPAAVFFTGV